MAKDYKITNVNDRVRFLTFSDGTRQVQKIREINKKLDDGTTMSVEEWSTESGWFGEYQELAMFSHISNILKDDGLKDVCELKEYIEQFNKSRSETKDLVVELIKNLKDAKN